MRLGPEGPDAAPGSTPDTLPLTTIDADAVEIRIPLAWLDLESGDVVRLAYREADEGGASGLSYSRNAHLRVR